MTTTPRMTRLPQVIALTGWGRDSIYRLGHNRKIGERASAWGEDEIRKWIELRPVAGEPLA